MLRNLRMGFVCKQKVRNPFLIKKHATFNEM